LNLRQNVREAGGMECLEESKRSSRLKLIGFIPGCKLLTEGGESKGEIEKEVFSFFMYGEEA